MFDIGFSELVLIFVVGLLVLGPEKLPGVIRTGSLWLAKLRRSFNDVRSEIEREVGFDEIKREIHNQAILDNLKQVKEELDDAGRQLDAARHDLQQLPHELQKRSHDIGNIASTPDEQQPPRVTTGTENSSGDRPT